MSNSNPPVLTTPKKIHQLKVFYIDGQWFHNTETNTAYTDIGPFRTRARAREALAQYKASAKQTTKQAV